MDDTNVNVLVKLFETLKESINKDEAATLKLIMQQLDLVNQIKQLPVSELKSMLKEHATESSDDIDECSGTVELKTDEILTAIAKLANRVKVMIVAVSVAITVATGGYFVIRAVNDNDKIDSISTIRQEIKLEQQTIIDDMTKSIREEMKKLHNEDADYHNSQDENKPE